MATNDSCILGTLYPLLWPFLQPLVFLSLFMSFFLILRKASFSDWAVELISSSTRFYLSYRRFKRHPLKMGFYSDTGFCLKKNKRSVNMERYWKGLILLSTWHLKICLNWRTSVVHGMCQVSQLSMEKVGTALNALSPPKKAFYVSALPHPQGCSSVSFTAPPGEGSTGCLVPFPVLVINTRLSPMIILWKVKMFWEVIPCLSKLCSNCT